MQITRKFCEESSLKMLDEGNGGFSGYASNVWQP